MMGDHMTARDEADRIMDHLGSNCAEVCSAYKGCSCRDFIEAALTALLAAEAGGETPAQEVHLTIEEELVNHIKHLYERLSAAQDRIEELGQALPIEQGADPAAHEPGTGRR